uniref:Uncharacterized protein n=1 Tax=Acrobeloides nanus TaxID=290746 RepID=A0A914DB45_9BILA
TKTSRKDG